MTVDYDSGSIKELNYRGIVLREENEEVFRAKTSDFLDDYHTVVDYARKFYKGFSLVHSPSIEHFIFESKLNLKWY